MIDKKYYRKATSPADLAMLLEKGVEFRRGVVKLSYVAERDSPFVITDSHNTLSIDLSWADFADFEPTMPKPHWSEDASEESPIPVYVWDTDARQESPFMMYLIAPFQTENYGAQYLVQSSRSKAKISYKHAEPIRTEDK